MGFLFENEMSCLTYVKTQLTSSEVSCVILYVP